MTFLPLCRISAPLAKYRCLHLEWCSKPLRAGHQCVTANRLVPEVWTVMFTQTNLNGSGSDVMLDAWLDFSFIGGDDGSNAPATSVDFALYADNTNTNSAWSNRLLTHYGEHPVFWARMTSQVPALQRSPVGNFRLHRSLTSPMASPATALTSFTSAVNTVPEPTILGLVGLGLVLGALARRRELGKSPQELNPARAGFSSSGLAPNSLAQARSINMGGIALEDRSADTSHVNAVNSRFSGGSRNIRYVRACCASQEPQSALEGAPMSLARLVAFGLGV